MEEIDKVVWYHSNKIINQNAITATSLNLEDQGFEQNAGMSSD